MTDEKDKFESAYVDNTEKLAKRTKSLKWQLKTLIPVFWIFVAIFVIVGINYYFFGYY